MICKLSYALELRVNSDLKQVTETGINQRARFRDSGWIRVMNVGGLILVFTRTGVRVSLGLFWAGSSSWKTGQKEKVRQFLLAGAGAGRGTAFDLCGGGRVMQSSNTV